MTQTTLGRGYDKKLSQGNKSKHLLPRAGKHKSLRSVLTPVPSASVESTTETLRNDLRAHALDRKLTERDWMHGVQSASKTKETGERHLPRGVRSCYNTGSGCLGLGWLSRQAQPPITTRLCT
jgi:hypothetical protein